MLFSIYFQYFSCILTNGTSLSLKQRQKVSPPVTFISPPPPPPPNRFGAHSVHLREKAEGSALKNNQSQTPALALWPMWPAGPRTWESPPQGPCYRNPDHSAVLGMARGWPHLAVSKEMPISRNCPSKSHGVTLCNAHRCACTDTRHALTHMHTAMVQCPRLETWVASPRKLRPLHCKYSHTITKSELI